MNPGENCSTEPNHLVGVPKRCPRLDCPNPTTAIVWRGSAKQLQYHCFGCWRKFNYGGQLRSWAKQVSPPKRWLQQHSPNVKEAPKLLELQSPSRSGPSRTVTPIRPSRRSKKSPSTDDHTPNAVHAAESSRKRNRRANANHVTNLEGTTAAATSGEDHSIRIGGNSTLSSIHVATESNGMPDGPGPRTSPSSDNASGMRNILDDPLGGDLGGDDTLMWNSFMSPEERALWDDVVQDGAGIVSRAAQDAAMMSNLDDPLVGDIGGDDTSVWHSFMNPEAHGLWDNVIQDGAEKPGIVSVAVAANDDNNPVVEGTSGLTNAPSGSGTKPRRRAMTLTFRQFSVPSKTFYYELQD